ncbi:transcriptional regulator [Pseudomonas sp. Irchel s3b6]|uniref:transcriptional regulator n=1 Tax=Pseudomonas sp. Irchel s3b6 TaxID=2009078 RepID=UPI000BA429FD|nr:winged helix-turn-helix domain-containing protein [Pseudomonas sp. Irchel s3b6]
MGRVLIDEQVVFDEDSFLLFRVDAPDVAPLRLGATTSSCLALLLRSGGAVVRKRELMEGAWGQYGLEVTDNSLAQSIRQLRLALETLQPGREFIQTLPRVGYKLADGVRTRALQAAGEEAASTPDSREIDHDLPDCAASTLPPVEDVVSVVAPSTTSPGPVEGGTSSVLARAMSAYKYWGLLIALILWGIASFFLGVVLQTPMLNTDLPVFAPPVTIEGMRVHVPVEGLSSLSASQLKTLAQRSQQLAQLLDIASSSANLYLIPVYHREHAILCDGELELARSRCVGVQLND